jgi:hypothetical protein
MRRYLAILALGALAASCGSNSSDMGNPGGTTGGTTIGTNGGTVTSTDGKVQLMIPAGALSKAGSFSVVQDSSVTPATGDALVAGSVYDFEPTGTTFAVPATIRIPYQASQLPVGTNQLFLSVFLRDGSSWDSIPSTLDTVAHVVTAAVSHFSDYGLCAGPCIEPATGIVRMDFSGMCCTVIPAGGRVTVTGAIEWNNTEVAAQVTLGQLPAGLTGLVQVGAQSAGCPWLCSAPVTVTLMAAAGVTAGRYRIPVNVAATGGVTAAGSNIEIAVTALAGFTLGASPDALSLTLGGSSAGSVSITRTAFTDPVTLSATNLPTGITASFNPAQLTGTTLSSTVTFTAGATAAPGTTNVVIHGSTSTLPDQVDTVAISVASFAIAAIPPTASLAPGSSTSTAITASRSSGFNGAITYVVTGLPTGLTASVNPTAVADSSRLVFTAAAGLAPGVYPLVVTATSGSVSEQVTVTVTVSNIGSSYRFDFSSCINKPLWIAYQDSTGPWTVVTGSNYVYTVPVFTSGKGAIASVEPTPVGHVTVVEYLTSAEVAATAANNDCQTSTGSTVNGAVAGIAGQGEVGVVSIGTASTSTFVNGPVQLTNVPNGATDVIAYLQIMYLTQSSTADRVIIHRGAGSPGTINFDAGVAPDSASATVIGGSGAPLSVQMGYITNASCQSALMYLLQQVPSPTFAITGVPASLQQAGDLHALMVTDVTASGGRIVTNEFHTLANQALTFGASLASAIDTLAGNYRRLRATLALPPDYGFASFNTGEGTATTQAINETSGYAAGGSMALAMPDFSGLPGFSAAWEPAPGPAQSYDLYASSGAIGGQACSDGSVVRSAYMIGNQ